MWVWVCYGCGSGEREGEAVGRIGAHARKAYIREREAEAAPTSEVKSVQDRGAVTSFVCEERACVLERMCGRSSEDMGRQRDFGVSDGSWHLLRARAR